MKISQKNIIAGVVVLVVIGLGFWANKVDKNRDYSVVYMTTGEVYVGILKTVPDFQLKNGYIFKVIKDATDPNKNNFQLQPIKDALWAPEVMHLIKDNIVFYGPLMSDSKIAEALIAQGK